MTNEKKITSRKQPPSKTSTMVETIYGCKWSLTIYALLKKGISRPGEMVRSTEGLSTKVLNTCLKRNVKFGILNKEVFPEMPPRVEYNFTNFGKKFTSILDQIEELNKKLEQGDFN